MREYVKRIVWLSCLCLFAICSVADDIKATDSLTDNTLPATVQELTKASYKEKALIVDSIAAIENDKKLLILQSLLDNKLYYQKKNNLDENLKRILIVDLSLLKAKKENAIIDAFSGDTVTGLSKRKIKKIGVNNALRRNITSQ